MTTPEEDLILVVSIAQKVVAFMHLTTLRDYYTQRLNGHVDDIAVDADWAGSGIGSMLMRRAEQVAIARDDDWLSLSVFPQNERAVHLYDRMGFKPDIARRVKPLKWGSRLRTRPRRLRNGVQMPA